MSLIDQSYQVVVLVIEKKEFLLMNIRSSLLGIVAFAAISLAYGNPAHAQWSVVGAYTSDPTDYPYSYGTSVVGYDETTSGNVSDNNGSAAAAYNGGGAAADADPPAGSLGSQTTSTAQYQSYILYGYTGPGDGNPDNPLINGTVAFTCSTEQSRTLSTDPPASASYGTSAIGYIGTTATWGPGKTVLNGSGTADSGEYSLSVTALSADYDVSDSSVGYSISAGAIAQYGAMAQSQILFSLDLGVVY